jgi:hypothetical protein
VRLVQRWLCQAVLIGAQPPSPFCRAANGCSSSLSEAAAVGLGAGDAAGGAGAGATAAAGAWVGGGLGATATAATVGAPATPFAVAGFASALLWLAAGLSRLRLNVMGSSSESLMAAG